MMKKYLLHLESFPTMEIRNYTRAPLLTTATTDHTLTALEFEKKICRSAFKKEFGQHLPGVQAELRMSVGFLNSGPIVSSSRWTAGPVKENKILQLPLPLPLSAAFGREQKQPLRNFLYKDQTILAPKLALKSRCLTKTKHLLPSHPNLSVGRQGCKVKDKRFLYSGIQLLSSDWLLELLIDQVNNKKSVRAVINSQIRDVESLMSQMQSSSPVIGVRITATGRLGKKKKAMSQQVSRSIGRVPLGTFRQKVDYSQGLAVTKLGIVGLKVWVSYGS